MVVDRWLLCQSRPDKYISFFVRNVLRKFNVCMSRLKWLTALLVQHYEGFHPDLVALNRQPTNQRLVKREVQEAPSKRSLASLHEKTFF